MDQTDVILRLQRKLKEAEELRAQAAQYGLQLLESQSDLQNQLEEQRNEMTGTIENLEQEKYSLQREVELKNRMLESLTSEWENVKLQQKGCLEHIQEQLERNHNRDISELKDKMEKLKSELDEARLSEKQLKHQLDHQSEVLANKSEELRMMSERAHESMTTEISTLQVEIYELESEKANLEEEINKLQYREQQLILANTNQSRHVERLLIEKEDREKEASGYCNALEKVREANKELQVQLDQALQQAQDPNSKGNSLFAEVEDRRAEMERQLISMKVQHQSLQKQHAFSRQQMHRMKVQIATLLQLKGTHADHEQLERLQSMVAQKNNEIEKLLVKVHQLEKYQQNCDNGSVKNSTDPLVQGDHVYYVDLLKMKLENSSKEIENIKDELSLQRMKALAESQRVLELERKLFTNDRHLKLSQGENMKLRVSLDELKMKYEPDEIIKLQTQKRRREQIPLDCPLDGVASGNGPSVCTTDPVPSTNKEEKENAVLLLESNACTPEKTHAEEVVSTVPPRQDKASGDQPVKERKRVRIVEDLHDTQTLSKSDCTITSPSARSSAEEWKFGPAKTQDTDFRKCERKSRRTALPILHVSSKPSAVTQCPQQ
ncbi:protein Spindly isoform X2 [Pseudophryne corroboree]|uniref:protein Spindly isoform X2 n=1 Tax=Pseudophryne corroboree TaxID=495146 RepID=UPI00308193FD